MNSQNTDLSNILASLRTIQQTSAYKAAYGSTKLGYRPQTGEYMALAIARLQNELSYQFTTEKGNLFGNSTGLLLMDRYQNTSNRREIRELRCSWRNRRRDLLTALSSLRTYCQRYGWESTRPPTQSLAQSFQQDRPKDYRNIVWSLLGSMETALDLKEAGIYVRLCHWLHLSVTSKQS